MKIETRWFQGRLADKKLTQRQLAKALRLDPSAVSRMLHGKRRMQIQEAVAFARLTGADLGEVLRRAGIDI